MFIEKKYDDGNVAKNVVALMTAELWCYYKKLIDTTSEILAVYQCARTRQYHGNHNAFDITDKISSK